MYDEPALPVGGDTTLPTELNPFVRFAVKQLLSNLQDTAVRASPSQRQE